MRLLSDIFWAWACTDATQVTHGGVSESEESKSISSAPLATPAEESNQEPPRSVEENDNGTIFSNDIEEPINSIMDEEIK